MVSVNEVPVIGVVVEGKLDQRFIEVYCGYGVWNEVKNILAVTNGNERTAVSRLDSLGSAA